MVNLHINQSREEEGIIKSCVFHKMASGSDHDSEPETLILKKARHDDVEWPSPRPSPRWPWYSDESEDESNDEPFESVSFTMLLPALMHPENTFVGQKLYLTGL